MAEVLQQHRDPEDACARLVDLAQSRGGPDNVTVVVACYQIDKGAIYDDKLA
jgi:serine/threonine protein phosphatase PrpC